MAFNTSVSKSSSRLGQQDRWWEYFCLILLMIAALILYTVNLGGLPLDQIQEATTTQIAQNLARLPFFSWGWIFPSLSAEINRWQSPLFPNLLAISYKIGGFSVLTSRLPSALLSVFSIAILYKIGRELFKVTPPTLLACCVYVTFFPAIIQGRLATINAPVLFGEMFTVWAILRSRRDLRWTLISGLGISLVGLTDLWSLIPLTCLIVGFLWWDTPRLLGSAYFYFGLILGMIPLIVWLIAQNNYDNLIINLPEYQNSLQIVISEISEYNLTQQSLISQSDKVLNWFSFKPFTHYLSRIFYYCSPWLIISFSGLRLAWQYRNWGWAKFILIVSSCCVSFFLLKVLLHLAAIEFPNQYLYVLPIYPVLALAAGMQLYQLQNLPSYITYPLAWKAIFQGSAIAIFLYGLYCQFIQQISFNWSILAIFASLFLTLVIAASLLKRREIQFMTILIWGSYISLLLFFSSQYWV